MICNQALQLDRPTKLEVAGYAILDRMGVSYERQRQIGPFCVDAFVEGRVIVEFDGEYWHGHPRHYSPTNAAQVRTMKKDKAAAAYFKKCGFPLVRLWETEVYKSPDDVIRRLSTAIVG